MNSLSLFYCESFTYHFLLWNSLDLYRTLDAVEIRMCRKKIIYFFYVKIYTATLAILKKTDRVREKDVERFKRQREIKINKARVSQSVELRE